MARRARPLDPALLQLSRARLTRRAAASDTGTFDILGAITRTS